MERHYQLRTNGDGERPAVMWAWTDRVNAEDIVYQIHKFKEGGINEFYIHPSWTMEIDDYLSEHFLSLIKLACDTAESLGMRYSVYDEYDWASGICAGKVPEKYPEARMTMLRWYRKDAQAGEPLEIWFRHEVLAVQVQYADKQRKREDITDRVRIEYFADGAGGRVLWNNENCCTASVWVFCRHYPEAIGAAGKWAPFTNNTAGFTDTLNASAVRHFLEMNNEAYKSAVGDRFGSTIRRLFTDETSMSPGSLEMTLDSRPWSAVIEEEFLKEHGYALRENLIALTEVSDSDDDIRVRHDFRSTCTRLFCTAYLDQCADWCHENGIKLTGHMSGEGVLYYHSMQMGDFYEALRRFDIPGVDNILSKHYMNVPSFAFETKMLASVAKFTGKDSTMCETFSGSGWDLTFEEAKRIMNRLMSLGVSYIIYMTAFFSMNEGRKNFPIGYPPSHGYNNPMFRHYSAMTDYVAVRSSLMTKTKPVGRALVMIPQVDAWVHTADSLYTGRLNRNWQNATLALQKANVEHDIFFEPLTAELEVKDGKLHLRGYTYDTIVLPYVRCSTESFLDKLLTFAAQGGRIVFVDALPYLAADTGKHYDFAPYCQCDGSYYGESVPQGSVVSGTVMQIRTGSEAAFDFDRYRDDLSAFVRAGSTAEPVEAMDVPQGVYLAGREAEGLYCCMICNDTDVSQTVTLKINADGKLSLLEGIKLRSFDDADGFVKLTVAPHDMPVLILADADVTIDGVESAEPETLPKGRQEEITLDTGWRFKTEKYNMLPLKMKYLAKAEPCGCLSDELQARAADIQVPYASQEFPAGEGLRYGDGYAAFARFEIAEIPDYLELFNEVVDDGELWLNGHRLTDFTKVKEWGVRDSVTEITPYVRVGTNVLIMVNRMPSWKGPHQMPSAVVRGAFRLRDGAIGVLSDEIKPAMYTTQGWRYYSGDASYIGSFRLDEKPARVMISLETVDVAEIIVNGASAGKLYWQPYEMDITQLCHEGENSLELRLTSNMSPTMVVEEVVLIRQGVSEYRDEAPAQKAGLFAAPRLTITYIS